MNTEEKRSLVILYIQAYNAFDLDGIMSVIHPQIEFNNIENDEVKVRANGNREFYDLTYHTMTLFSARKQTITELNIEGDRITADIFSEGTLLSDLPNGMKAGEKLKMNGFSEFSFRDGKIVKVIDVS